MFYSFSHITEATDTAAAPKRLNMDLTAGVIHQVDVLFQSGTLHAINVQIHKGGHQLYPSNRGAALRGDATVISFREFLELKPGDVDLYALIWTTDTDVLKEVLINIGLLPREIIQPLSYEELLRAVKE
jgi:hypothetical protein